MKVITGFARILLMMVAGVVPVVQAATTVSVGSYSVAPLTEFTVAVSVSSAEDVVALQCDMPLPEGFRFVENSAVLNPGRVDGHVLTVSLLTGNVVRVLAYSAGNKAFKGEGGELVSFRLVSGPTPATVGLPLDNVLVSNAQSQALPIDVTEGSVTVEAPDLRITTTRIDFGRVALQSSGDRMVELLNAGNKPMSYSRVRI